MNNIYILKIFLPFVLLGCAPNLIEKNTVLQKIDNLDMNIFSNKGEKIYSITSPYSSYDNKKLEFQLKNTTINIFKGEETKYIINFLRPVFNPFFIRFSKTFRTPTTYQNKSFSINRDN